MSAISQDTFVIPGVAVSGSGGGGGGGGGVSQIIAGANIGIDPAEGTGIVTVSYAPSNGFGKFSTITMADTPGGIIYNVSAMQISSINGQDATNLGGNNPNPTPSTITMGASPAGSILGVTNLTVSSINGVAPGATAANIEVSTIKMQTPNGTLSSFTISNTFNGRYTAISEQPGGFYMYSTDANGSITGSFEMGATGEVPGEAVIIKLSPTLDANAVIITNTGMATSSITVSTINGVRADDIPYAFEYNSVPLDKVISAMTLDVNTYGTYGVWASTVGAPISPFVSTVTGQRYLQSGVFALQQEAATPLPPGTPNAYAAVFAGCGNASGQWTNNIYPYPYVSTMLGIGGLTQARAFSYISGSGGTINNQPPSTQPSTINYTLVLSPDWPVPVKNVTSTFVGATLFDISPITAIDLGQVNLLP